MSSERLSTETGRSGSLGALALGLDLANAAVLATVRDLHQAVAERMDQVVGLVDGDRTGVRAAGDGVAPRVYGAIGVGLALATRGLAAVDRVAVDSGLTPALEERTRGRSVVSGLNGIFGDRIRERHPGLSITMAVRRDGHDVLPRRDVLAAAFPEAGAELVVFVHGLSETESCWERRHDETGGSYGDRLAVDEGWTPLYVRANSGLALAESSVELSGLLTSLVEQWPVPVRRIALVGHSMGGLIIRGSCAVVTDQDEPWSALVTDVVTLGTPHLGAPIAQLLTAGSSGLARVPETAPFGRVLDHRSPGILDLRTGLPRDVANLPHARYHLVGATVTRSPTNLLAEVAGDLLVHYPSAIGRTRRGRELFPGADTLHVPGADHFDLLNDEVVYTALRGWLERRPAAA